MWYARAAEQEHSEAQFILGTMYEKGDGVPRNDDQAYRWISLAARQGHARARVMLESDSG
jgi:TPR repeat protein